MANQFREAALVLVLKICLFIFNIMLWFSCVILFCVGLWAEFDLFKYSTSSSLSSAEICTSLLVLIGLAGVTIILSCAAFSFILKGHPVLLYIYGGFLACVTVLDLGLGAAVVVCYRDSFGKAVYEGLMAILLSPNEDKPQLDFAQSNLHCCGVNNYTDWTRLSPLRIVPLSCCQDYNTCVTANYGDLFQRGCYDVITEYIAIHLNVIIGVTVGVALLPLLGTLISCVFAGYVKKLRYDEPVE